jgi:hypothetical protein
MTVVQRVDPEAAARVQERRRREATVTITLTAPGPGRIGAVLDELLPVLQEIVGLLAVDGVRGEVAAVQGYHDTFYGLESDQDDGPA